MLASFVGEDKFLKGVSIYLHQRLYGNSVARDLWDGIAEATGLDIPTIMENWIMKVSAQRLLNYLRFQSDVSCDGGRIPRRHCDRDGKWGSPSSGSIPFDRKYH